MSPQTDPTRMAIAELLRETGKAHHHAFAATDGDDPEWPAWYATYLATRLGAILGNPLEQRVLAIQLAEMEEERKVRGAPAADWSLYYAERLVARCTSGRATSRMRSPGTPASPARSTATGTTWI